MHIYIKSEREREMHRYIHIYPQHRDQTTAIKNEANVFTQPIFQESLIAYFRSVDSNSLVMFYTLSTEILSKHFSTPTKPDTHTPTQPASQTATHPHNQTATHPHTHTARLVTVATQCSPRDDASTYTHMHAHMHTRTHT